MSREAEKPSFFEKLATVIVDKRNLIFFLYACALVFCLFSRNWVSVCNDITEYLPDTTETRQGLTLMEEEFTTFGTARVMVSHVTYDLAEELAEQMEQIEGVTSASLEINLGYVYLALPLSGCLTAYYAADNARALFRSSNP